MKRLLLLLILDFSFCTIYSQEKNYPLLITFLKPSTDWMTQSIPISNGYMGAMIFGGVYADEIQFTEESLWRGGEKIFFKNNMKSYKKNSYLFLDSIRHSLHNNDKQSTNYYAKKYFTGNILEIKNNHFIGFGAQQGIGSFWVILENAKNSLYTNYKRTLDLNTSTVQVSYDIGNIHFENQYFASYPQNVIIAHYKNNNPQGQNYSINLSCIQKQYTIHYDINSIFLKGCLSDDNEMQFAVNSHIKTDGKVTIKNNLLKIKNATFIELYFSATTDYKNQYPDYKANIHLKIDSLEKRLQVVQNLNYQNLLSQHIQDYQNLFHRVSLQLGTTSIDTQQDILSLIKQFRKNNNTYLPILAFQYGRYLLISSSRQSNQLPAHLQGKWNYQTNPPWACDYHMNINFQMNYWLAESTNLSECLFPFFYYVESLKKSGKITASNYFQARGWVVNTMNNIWGYTAPGWEFNWGYAPNSAAWLSRTFYEHFLYQQDTFFLKNRVYPLIIELSQFWIDYLTKDKDSTWVSSPSFSPEHGDISIGASIDQEIVWELFNNTIETMNILNIHNSFKDSLIEYRSYLSLPKIGKYDQLQEWKEDIDDTADKHRHISHLYILYPSSQLGYDPDNRLWEASKKSLEYRGLDGTGWSLAWKLNLWARLKDGEQAYLLIRNFLRLVGDDNHFMGGGVYSNLLCAHPPFQIDGNLGFTAGIAEMLVQSYKNNEISFLPALPKVWDKGSCKGIKARGNITINMEWRNYQVTQLTLTTSIPQNVRLIFNRKIKHISLQEGDNIINVNN